MVTRDRDIAHPITGELIDLDDATPEDLGELRLEMYDLKRLAEAARSRAEAELKKRAKAQGSLSDGICRWIVSTHTVTHVFPEPIDKEMEPIHESGLRVD